MKKDPSHLCGIMDVLSSHGSDEETVGAETADQSRETTFATSEGISISHEAR